MNFDKFNSDLLEKGKDIVVNEKGLSNVLRSLLNNMNIGEINFDAFTEDDILSASDELSFVLYFEDEDDFESEDGFLNEDSPVTMFYSISHKIHLFETVPRKRIPSSYKFL